MFNDNFQAWIYEPVLPEIYKDFYKILGDNDFEEVNEYFNGKKEVKVFLDEITKEYGNLNVFKLFKKNTWRKVINKC